nr:non-oxidative hydroxyarylic acid decarboxylases subunit B [Catenulispora rubra]
MRLIVAMTGATGAPFGVRLLEALRTVEGVETHLVLSRWARTTIELETPYTAREVTELADVSYGPGDQAAVIASGSFRTDGMVVIPCSMKTLAGIRAGYADDLIGRAADVVLKERRKLVLVPRETPFSEIHLDNMLALSRMGVVVAPPVPAFYNRPGSVDDIIDHVVARVLDQFDIAVPFARRWNGLADAPRYKDPVVPARAAPAGAGVPGEAASELTGELNGGLNGATPAISRRPSTWPAVAEAGHAPGA